VLDATPGAKLLLKAKGLHDEKTRARLGARFEELGLMPERFVMLPWSEGTATHLAAYNEVDVALDPLPYNGATTTCEALWMGVPVVTLAGRTHPSRMGKSILMAAGCAEWIAADEDEYVRIASGLAGDAEGLARIRAGLRGRLAASSLMDAARFAGGLEEAFERMWREQTAG